MNCFAVTYGNGFKLQ